MSSVPDDTKDVQSVSSEMTVAEFANEVAHGISADGLNEAADLTIEDFGEWAPAKQMLVLAEGWNGPMIEILNSELAHHPEVDRSDVSNAYHAFLHERDDPVEFIENNPDVAEDVALLRGMTIDELVESRADWDYQTLKGRVREDLSEEQAESLGYDTDKAQ